MTFLLHERLREDCFEVAALTTCTVLLMNDARFPWCILVPRFPGVTEIHTLTPSKRTAVWDEVHLVSRVMDEEFVPDKLNVAAIGNLVPQLHIHVVARYADDPAWPSPVWGFGSNVPYAQADATMRLEALRGAISRATG